MDDDTDQIPVLPADDNHSDIATTTRLSAGFGSGQSLSAEADGDSVADIEHVVTPHMSSRGATIKSGVSYAGGPAKSHHPWNLLAWPLRRKLRVLWAFLVTGFLCGLPVLIWDLQENQWAAHYQAWFISGLFCLLSIPVTLYEVALHLEYYSQPQLQKHIIRILFMPPIYALDAWFCLRFSEARTWLTPLRESYEAYTIYNFFMYLIRFLEGQVGPVENYMATSSKQQVHYFPFDYVCHPWPMGREFYQACRKGVLNYVILRPITTAMMFVALITNPSKYDEGKFAWDNLWPYTAFINNVSQGWALYCLFLFYLAMHDELAPIHPLRKVVTIKLVVFFSFWQGLMITLMAEVGLLRVNATLRTYDAQDLAGGLQDFIICIEMFVAALAFAWAFPPRDYMTGSTPGFWTTLHTLLDFRDVVDDVQGRVHEEYKDITTRPLSVIIAPIRNTPLFTRQPVHMSQLENDSAESEPLYTKARSHLLPAMASEDEQLDSSVLIAPTEVSATDSLAHESSNRPSLTGSIELTQLNSKSGMVRMPKTVKHQD